MPTYEYKCDKCGAVVQMPAKQKFPANTIGIESETEGALHGNCEAATRGHLRRIYSTFGIVVR